MSHVFALMSYISRCKILVSPMDARLIPFDMITRVGEIRSRGSGQFHAPWLLFASIRVRGRDKWALPAPVRYIDFRREPRPYLSDSKGTKCQFSTIRI